MRQRTKRRPSPPPNGRFLTKTLDSFRREGAELDPPAKSAWPKSLELTKVTTEILRKTVLDSTNALNDRYGRRRSWQGFPSAIAARVKAPSSKQLSDGDSPWRPEHIPVLTYLDDRSVREQIYRASPLARRNGSRNRPLLGAHPRTAQGESPPARLPGFCRLRAA